MLEFVCGPKGCRLLSYCVCVCVARGFQLKSESGQCTIQFKTQSVMV